MTKVKSAPTATPIQKTIKRLKSLFKKAQRWAFRLCGGLHRLEHEEIVHEKLCKAEVETAQLRLYKHQMEFRHRSLNRMLSSTLDLKERLDAMTDDERMSIFLNYCTHCGEKRTPCYCWNDD